MESECNLNKHPSQVLRPVSTQENKHRIGLDSFPSRIIHTAGPKKVENTSTLYLRVADHRFKLELKIGTESPCADSNIVPIRSDPMLIFLSGDRL